eukprot:gene21639-28648_t
MDGTELEYLLGKEGSIPHNFDVMQFKELLGDLKELEDLEAGGSGYYVDEADVLQMNELVREMPREVIQWLEEEGVVKLWQFEIQDSLAFKAFRRQRINDRMLTMGNEHLDMDWEAEWKSWLAEVRTHRSPGWASTVTVEAHAVNIKDAAAEGGCQVAVFGLPAVEAVINFKWRTWAKRFLIYELLLYSCWLLAFVGFSLLFDQEDDSLSLAQLLHLPSGVETVGCSLLALAFMCPFIYMDACTMIAYKTGWINARNCVDVVTYGLQIAITTMHLQRFYLDNRRISLLISVQHLLLWSKLFYFAKAFTVKNMILDSAVVVIDAIKGFLLFLLLMMMAFAFSFYALFRKDHESVDFHNFWHAIASMFSYLLDMFDLNVFYNSSNPTASMILFLLFEFFLAVMLLNILIAVMTAAFYKAAQDEGLRYLFSKAVVIDELEAMLPHCFRDLDVWHPHFVHILKIHPVSSYEVNLNSVWSGIGLLENKLVVAHEEMYERQKGMEDMLSRVNKKLDVAIKMLGTLPKNSLTNSTPIDSLTRYPSQELPHESSTYIPDLPPHPEVEETTGQRAPSCLPTPFDSQTTTAGLASGTGRDPGGHLRVLGQGPPSTSSTDRRGVFVKSMNHMSSRRYRPPPLRRMHRSTREERATSSQDAASSPLLAHHESLTLQRPSSLDHPPTASRALDNARSQFVQGRVVLSRLSQMAQEPPVAPNSAPPGNKSGGTFKEGSRDSGRPRSTSESGMPE